MLELKEHLKSKARSLGFDLVGVARAESADDFEAFQHWLDAGHAGSMDYLGRRPETRRHPESILADVRSVVMLGINYKPVENEQETGPKVARYARGADYHHVLWAKLDALLRWVMEQVPEAKGRGVVDTAPLLERGFARRAGLGWVGKNTMLLQPRLGSYFFLAALLLDLDLGPDPAFDKNHCGACTACLEACPTDAFPAPYQLDARRCISYLTIELRGPIPAELRADIGPWVFGCDICQEVCPWNRKAPAAQEPELQPRPELDRPKLEAWLNMTEDEYRRQFRDTALTRAKRNGLRRNAAIVLGNLGDARSLPALEQAAKDEDATVREAAEWAIERISRRDSMACEETAGGDASLPG